MLSDSPLVDLVRDLFRDYWRALTFSVVTTLVMALGRKLWKAATATPAAGQPGQRWPKAILARMFQAKLLLDGFVVVPATRLAVLDRGRVQFRLLPREYRRRDMERRFAAAGIAEDSAWALQYTTQPIECKQTVALAVTDQGDQKAVVRLSVSVDKEVDDANLEELISYVERCEGLALGRKGIQDWLRARAATIQAWVQEGGQESRSPRDVQGLERRLNAQLRDDRLRCLACKILFLKIESKVLKHEGRLEFLARARETMEHLDAVLQRFRDLPIWGPLRWIPLGLLLFVVGLVALPKLGAPPRTSGGSPPKATLFQYYCKDQTAAGEVDDQHVPSPNRQGLNPVNYVQSPPYTARELLSKLHFDTIDGWRETKIREKLNHYLDLQRGEWFGGGTLKPLLADKDLYKNLTLQTGDASKFIILYDHRAYADCVAGTYNYIVSFWIPKNPLLVFPEDLRGLIETRIDAIVREKLGILGAERGGTAELNTHDVLARLFRDRMLQKEFTNAITRIPYYETLLGLVDRSTRDFLERIRGSMPTVFPFRSGEYRLSGEMLYTLDAIVKTFLRTRDVTREYKIITRGYADSDPIKGYIRYDGDAEVRLEIGQIVPLSVSRRADHYDKLSSNLELSVARGYSGARLIDETIRGKIKNREELRSIGIYYSGGGAIPGPATDSHRRIDVIIQTPGR